MSSTVRKRGRRGNAMVEVALLAPWIFFLFVGVLDFGFYSYALICTQNAARVAALANSAAGSATDNTGACNIAIQEMNSLVNTRTLTTCSVGTCPSTTASVSHTQPLAVTACAFTGPDGAAVARVIVTYLLSFGQDAAGNPIGMIPIPGVLTGQLTITRTVDVPMLNLAPV